MPPTLKSMGFTLSGSTAATRHPASALTSARLARRSIQGPITTAPAAWRSRRRPVSWPARTCCDSTALACMSYRPYDSLATARSTEVEPDAGPEGVARRGLKVVCLPIRNAGPKVQPGQAQSHPSFQPAQGRTKPGALTTRRRLNRYPSDG